MSKLKKVPKFRSEKEELEFWSGHDSADYIDYSKTKRVLVWDEIGQSLRKKGYMASDVGKMIKIVRRGK